eukprot:2658606-Rhodomonas_salina.1
MGKGRNDAWETSIFKAKTPEPDVEELLCPICYFVKEKKFLSQCARGKGLIGEQRKSDDRHWYCLDCIKGMVKPTTTDGTSLTMTCVYCREETKGFREAVHLDNDEHHATRLRNKLVNCQALGCAWLGSFAEHEQHINVCEKVKVKCNICSEFEGREVTVSRNAMRAHLCNDTDRHMGILLE